MTVSGRFLPLQPNDQIRPKSAIQVRCRERRLSDRKAVVQMQNGKAVIVEMGDVRAWLDAHIDVLKKHFDMLGI